MEMDTPVVIDIVTEVNTSEQVNETENINEIGTSDAEPSTEVITSSEDSKEEKEKESAKSQMDQLHRLIAKDVTRLHNEKPCKDMDTVLTYDINNWLSELVKHLQELCNLDFSPHSQYPLGKVIEQIYNCRNTRLILPLDFRENLITYKLSNNPFLFALNSSATSSGSHTYLTSRLNEAASTEIEFPPGTVRVVFDNKQIIGKRYRVKANQSSVPTSVIKSTIYLSIDESS